MIRTVYSVLTAINLVALCCGQISLNSFRNSTSNLRAASSKFSALQVANVDVSEYKPVSSFVRHGDRKLQSNEVLYLETFSAEAISNTENKWKVIVNVKVANDGPLYVPFDIEKTKVIIEYIKNEKGKTATKTLKLDSDGSGTKLIKTEGTFAKLDITVKKIKGKKTSGYKPDLNEVNDKITLINDSEFAASSVPSSTPSLSPSPSAVPSDAPSSNPSAAPSDVPSDVPSSAPSDVPSSSPSSAPSDVPSSSPSSAPSCKIVLEEVDAGAYNEEGGKKWITLVTFTVKDCVGNPVSGIWFFPTITTVTGDGKSNSKTFKCETEINGECTAATKKIKTKKFTKATLTFAEPDFLKKNEDIIVGSEFDDYISGVVFEKPPDS